MSDAAAEIAGHKITDDMVCQARECVWEAAATVRECAPDATAFVLDPGPAPHTAGSTVRLVRVLGDIGTCLLAEPTASSILDLVELHLNEALNYVPLDTLAAEHDGHSRHRLLPLPPCV